MIVALVITLGMVNSSYSEQATAATADLWFDPVASNNPGATNICTQYMFVGVRGSAEHNQLGNTLDKVRQNFRQRMDDSGANRVSIRSVYLEYPAASTKWLLVGGLGTYDVPSYYQYSINQGTSNLRNLLADSQKRCKSTNEKWILAGYSQGGSVVDNVLASMTKAQLTQVAAVLLVGDAGNYPKKPRLLVGSHPDAKGRGAYDLGGYRVRTPQSLSSITYSLCSYDDSVCDTNSAFEDHFVSQGLDIHSNYKNDPNLAGYFNPLAELIAHQATPTPTPTPTPTTTPTSTLTPTPTMTPAPTVPDSGLRACFIRALAEGGIDTSDPTPAQLATLTELRCGIFAINSLEGLEYALNLEQMSLVPTNKPTLDLSPLRKLLKLRWLSINQISKTSFSPISALVNLEYAFFSEDEISDVSPFGSLPKLKSLGLYGNHISDLSPLTRLLSTVGAGEYYIQANGQTLVLPPTSVNAVNAIPYLSGRTAGIQPGIGVTSVPGVLAGGKVQWLASGTGVLSWKDPQDKAGGDDFTSFEGTITQSVK